MAALHIEEFCADCARTLLQLYLLFPRPGSVFVEDICGPDTADEFGLHSKRHLACLGSMIWLSEEGYLRYESTIRQEAIDQAVLTRKGLVLMNSVYQPEHDGRVVADVLVDLIRDGTSSELADFVHALLLR